MMNTTIMIISVISVGLASFAAGYLLFTALQKKSARELVKKREEAEYVIRNAQKEVGEKKREALLEAKEEALKIRRQGEGEIKEQRVQLQKLEKRILQKEETLEQKLNQHSEKEKDLKAKEQEIKEVKTQIQQEINLQRKKLEEISGMSVDEGKKMLLDSIESEVRLESAKKIKEYEHRVKDESARIAREIVTLAVQRCAVDHVAESTVSVVPLPSDEMKGRLIGREGRNIRTFEMLTGVDLIVDDTPGAVVLSSFDPLRRETARLTLEKLISDGRIQPARIEEMVEKSKLEMEERIREEGEKALLKVGLTGLHTEIVKLLGRLHFRTSYSQNCLKNCVEASILAANLASELGADVQLAKRAALLHDVGKAVSHEVEGPHALIGAEIAMRYKESKGVVHAIAAHHGDEEAQTLEAVIVQVADAISAARPGARGDTFESYIKRLEQLEKVVDGFEGVEKSYAIQAGRELRVIVKPEEMDDAKALLMARDMAKKIEATLQYPGQIKVTVIRETRCVEYAK